MTRSSLASRASLASLASLGLLALLVSSACGSHEHDDGTHAHPHDGDADAELPALVYTHWTDQTELFVELPALRVGEESPCAAHVTILEGFRPPSEGTVTAVLSGGGAPEERFSIDTPTIPGIFRPIAVPRAAGARSLRFEIEVEGISAVHDLGEVRVYATTEEAIAGAPEEVEHPGRIVFLKEQQWPIQFGTAIVQERALHASTSAPAVLRTRSDGDAWIVAPAAGRIVATEAGFPGLGRIVERDGVLATLAPQLASASDRASLDLGRSASRIDVQRAAQERERLEGLVASGAVPERRLVDARFAEAQARAALTASERRLGQYAGVQRAGGRGRGGLDVRAPISGMLAETRVAPGSFVAADDPLFRIVDPSTLWLEIRVPEIDVPLLDPDRGGWVVIQGRDDALALDPAAFVARAPIVDPESHTVSVIYSVPNPDGRLSAGALATAHLHRGEPVAGVAVPRSALVEDGAATVVFVQVEGEAFERRVVRVSAREGDLVGIREGLRPGERVVSRGAYSVRLAASSGSVPAHGHAH